MNSKLTNNEKAYALQEKEAYANADAFASDLAFSIFQKRHLDEKDAVINGLIPNTEDEIMALCKELKELWEEGNHGLFCINLVSETKKYEGNYYDGFCICHVSKDGKSGLTNDNGIVTHVTPDLANEYPLGTEFGATDDLDPSHAAIEEPSLEGYTWYFTCTECPWRTRYCDKVWITAHDNGDGTMSLEPESAIKYTNATRQIPLTKGDNGNYIYSL